MIDKAKVRDLAMELRRCQFNFYEEIIAEWLEQNQPEPVVVGLSDEQIHSLAYYIGNGDYDNLKWSIGIWQRGHEFPKCDEYERTIRALKKELEQLKSQQFKPDWSGVPEKITEIATSVYYVTDSGNVVYLNESKVQRSKPTPQVGQVWQYKGGSKYHIDSLGKMKFEPHTGWVDCVTFRKLEGRDAGKFFTRTLDDFLAKFVRVSDDS